ncbi:hypothetical protein RRF57_006082 [Xylaria bambusicola]|uniref:Uncharacterized protein n=1 Tax=Xylaria bambusicola TaxID=326684 RepID=A0AAN7Z6J3_9PEZI
MRTGQPGNEAGSEEFAVIGAKARVHNASYWLKPSSPATLALAMLCAEKWIVKAANMLPSNRTCVPEPSCPKRLRHTASRQGTDLFILDGSDGDETIGFPRSLEQAQLFEETVALIEFIIVLECTDALLIDRLLPRERFDDNLENIRKRLRTFYETTSKVVLFFRGRGQVKTVNTHDDVKTIHHQLVDILESRKREYQENRQHYNKRASGDRGVKLLADGTELNR